jgi:RNA methyltransferase, TrmH family
MLSKQQISYVRSLHQKKFRQMYAKFMVEGDKLVRELLTSNFQIEAIFKLSGTDLPLNERKVEVLEVTEDELKKISTHETPNQALAIAAIPETVENQVIHADEPGPFIVCDNLNDPGNAGTIIRTADWFGIQKVFFSPNSVDIYNPKAVSAAKGSLFRVQCTYVDLPQLFEANTGIPVYGTFMDGQNIYTSKNTTRAFIVIGNEANGISPALFPYIRHKIAIPSFGQAESLNAGIAAGIIMSEFKRQNIAT